MQRRKNCYVIGVNDNGMGISPDMVNTIFDSYSIGHQDEKIESHGLGLSISKQLVEELGGKIWVESILGHKTTFSFTISK
jgi:signal transduction histidine kinase